MAMFFFIFPEGNHSSANEFQRICEEHNSKTVTKPWFNENYTTADITTLSQRAPP